MKKCEIFLRTSVTYICIRVAYSSPGILFVRCDRISKCASYTTECKNNTFTRRKANQRPGGKDHTRLKRGPGRGVSSDTRLELPMSPCSSLTNRNRPERSGAPGLHRDDNGRRDVTTCVAFARGSLAAAAPTYTVGVP